MNDLMPQTMPQFLAILQMFILIWLMIQVTTNK